MAELTQRDAPDDGFHEIQLSGKQLVFLFMATTIVGVVIFLLGVEVGRGSPKSDRLADAGEIAAAAPPPAAAPSQPAASTGPPAAEPPAPAQEPDDELSYAKRLQSESAPAEKLKSPSPAPAATEPPKPVKAAPAHVAASTPGAQPGNWIVQLTALQDRTAAATFARRLTAKGYPAFVMEPAPGAPAIYRVQVGGYADRDTADQIARRLEKDEQIKGYVRSR